MFKMMLNAADRMVDKLRLMLSEKDRQIDALQEEVKHLKQVIVDARMTESRLVATMEEGNQKWNSICNRWRQRAEDAEFKVMTLEFSTKRQHLESTLEKLLNVSNKLDSAETKVREMESQVREMESQVREMQRFIDTLPDGLRGAWSTYLMTKKDEEMDDDIG